MMALTHGAVGVALAALLTPVVPEAAVAPLLAVAFLGGVAPDLDIVADHRKTLHYPVGYTVLALVVAGGYALVPTGTLLLGAAFVASAAVHAWSDALAGGVETAPWKPTTERAVYNHALGAWHRPRRYVRYSGAPEDWLLAVGAAAVAVHTPATGPTAEAGLLFLLAVAGAYTLARKRLSGVGRLLAMGLPARLLAALPTVAVEETDSGTTTLSVRRRS